MKELVFILLVSVGCYAQEFTGKWHVVVFEDQKVYANKLKDSIVIKDPHQHETATDFKKLAEEYIYKSTLTFYDNGTVETFDPLKGSTASQYEIDRINKQIITIEKNGKREEASYTFENGILFIHPSNHNATTIIGFMKE